MNRTSSRAVPQAGANFTLVLRTRDIDEIARAFGNWDAEFRQISAGPFSGELRVLRAGGVEVLRVSGNQMIRAEGVQRQRRFLYNPVLPCNQGAMFRGRHLRSGLVNVLGPRDVIDHRTTPEFEICAVNIDEEVVRRAAATLFKVDPDDGPGWEGVFQPSAEGQARVERLIAELLALTAERPNERLNPVEAAAIEERCLRVVLGCLLGSQISPSREDRGWRQRRDVARQAEALMAAQLKVPLSISDLCRALDVSERTLEYAFREQFSLGPLAYYKSRRLHAARQELKYADPADVTVAGVAESLGFRHQGVFAADYRRLFGELPSETLSR